MANYTLTTPDRDGAVVTVNSAAASDFIPRALLGKRGVTMTVINGNASPDTVVVSDASTTRTGAAAAANSVSVTNGTSKAFKITPDMATPGSAGGVTVTHTVTATVTVHLTARD